MEDAETPEVQLHYDLNGKYHSDSPEILKSYPPATSDSTSANSANSHFASRYVAEPNDWRGTHKRHGRQTYRCRACGVSRIIDRVYHDRHVHPQGPTPFDSPVTIQKMYETLRELFE